MSCLLEREKKRAPALQVSASSGQPGAAQQTCGSDHAPRTPRHQQTPQPPSPSWGLAACARGQLCRGIPAALGQTCVTKSSRKPWWWPPPFTPELHEAQTLLLPKLLHWQIRAWLHPLLALAHWLEFPVWHHISLISVGSSGNEKSVDWCYYNNQISSALLLLAQVPCSSWVWNSSTQGCIFKPSP